MTKGLVVWEGDQKNLFRKYASRREAAVNEILGRLNDLKEEGL